MTANLEQRARELLIKEMDRIGFTQTAYDLRHPGSRPDGYVSAALRAIESALKGQPASSEETADIVEDLRLAAIDLGRCKPCDYRTTLYWRAANFIEDAPSPPEPAAPELSHE